MSENIKVELSEHLSRHNGSHSKYVNIYCPISTEYEYTPTITVIQRDNSNVCIDFSNFKEFIMVTIEELEEIHYCTTLAKYIADSFNYFWFYPMNFLCKETFAARMFNLDVYREKTSEDSTPKGSYVC